MTSRDSFSPYLREFLIFFITFFTDQPLKWMKMAYLVNSNH